MSENQEYGELPPRANNNNLESKSDEIEKIRKRDKKILQSWLQEIKEDPRLDMPKEVIRGLIPDRVFELASDPTKVDVKIEDVDEGEASFFVCEQNPVPITNVDSFTRARDSHQEECPRDVDTMHWKYGGAFAEGKIGANDKVIFHADLSRIGPHSDADLHIEYFEVREDLKKQGIAKSFYEGLREFAGGRYQYITGQNASENWDVFRKLGRQRYADLTPEEQLRMDHMYGDALGDLSWFSVDDLRSSK